MRIYFQGNIDASLHQFLIMNYALCIWSFNQYIKHINQSIPLISKQHVLI